MKWLPPSQRGLTRVTAREREATYEQTKLYRVVVAAGRLLAAGERCRWMPCGELSAARMALRMALEHVEGWSDRFFSTEGDSHE